MGSGVGADLGPSDGFNLECGQESPKSQHTQSGSETFSTGPSGNSAHTHGRRKPDGETES